MSVNRISDFNISQRELLSGIFGNTRNSEYFIDKDLCAYNISKSLFMYLKGEGYKVVLYNPTNNIGFYSYEEEDLALFSGFSRQSTIRTSNSNETGDGLQASDKFVRKGDHTSYVPKFNTPFGKIEPRFDSGNKKEPSCTSDKTQTTKQDASSQKQSVRNIKCHYPQIYFHNAGRNSFFKRQSSTDVFDEVFGYSDNNPNDRMAVIFEYPENICPPKPDQIENRFGELSKVYGEENRQMKMIILFGFQTSGQLAAAYDREHGGQSGVFFRDSFGTLLGLASSNKQNDADREIYMENFERNMFCIDLPQEDEIENWLIRKRICDDVRCTLSPKPFESLKRGIAMGNFKFPNKEGILEFAKMNERKIVKLNRPDLNIEQLINTVSADDAEKQLRNLDGMEDVVSQIESLKNLIIINRRQKEETGHGLPVYPHMVFMGNPGTGKTTVAHLVAQWFREENVLSKGTFVSAKVADLVGQYIGETRIKAQALCERARGGLLFIDEAYGLREKKNKEGVSYEAEAVEILIQYMTKPDFMVILAGYKDEMEDLLNNSNSNDGLRSRISDDGIIMFRDYNPNTLVKILERNLTHPKTNEFTNAIRMLVEVLYTQRNLRKWGNARAMEQLAASIYKEFYKNNGTVLDICHIPEEYKKMIDTEQKTEQEILQGLDKLVGLKKVKETITGIYYQKRRNCLRIKEGRPRKEEDLVFVFTGAPGTGKTTVARLLGGILHDLGLLRSSDYLERGSEDFIDRGMEKNIEEIFDDSVGKTLFIDEAYGIYERGGKSAITQIVRLLTDPRYQGKMALIMAGYPEKMNRFLEDNEGLNSRVSHTIEFDNYSNEELWQILQLNMKQLQRHFSDEEQCHRLALSWFGLLPRTKDFGNARVIEKQLLPLLEKNNDRRLRRNHIEDVESMDEYTPEDFPDMDLPEPNTAKGPVTIKLSCNPFFEDGYKYDNYRKATGLIKLDNGNVGTGSGFLISQNGYIITCAHCTVANKISFVKDDDKKEFEADVIYKNDLIDIAILKIDANNMPYLSISDSVRPLKVGEEIVIMAYPSGTEISDNVSAFEGKVSNFINANKTYITDAVAAPGSSGGALIAKKDGKVYGVLQGGYKEILEVDINASFDIRNLFKQNDIVIEFT